MLPDSAVVATVGTLDLPVEIEDKLEVDVTVSTRSSAEQSITTNLLIEIAGLPDCSVEVEVSADDVEDNVEGCSPLSDGEMVFSVTAEVDVSETRLELVSSVTSSSVVWLGVSVDPG